MHVAQQSGLVQEPTQEKGLLSSNPSSRNIELYVLLHQHSGSYISRNVLKQISTAEGNGPNA